MTRWKTENKTKKYRCCKWLYRIKSELIINCRYNFNLTTWEILPTNFSLYPYKIKFIQGLKWFKNQSETDFYWKITFQAEAPLYLNAYVNRLALYRMRPIFRNFKRLYRDRYNGYLYTWYWLPKVLVSLLQQTNPFKIISRNSPPKICDRMPLECLLWEYV